MGWGLWLLRKSEGRRVPGTVVRKMENGITIELERGIFAKIPFHELAWDPQMQEGVYNNIELGAVIKVVIIEIYPDEQRIVASIKKAYKQWEKIKSSYAVGQKLRGTVVRLIPSGAFVQSSEGLEGFIPTSEVSPFSVKTPEQALFIGDDVMCIVTNIDDKKKELSLSVKKYLNQLADNNGKTYLSLKGEKTDATENKDIERVSCEDEIEILDSKESIVDALVQMKKIEEIGKILVIDDEEKYLDSFKSMLEAMEHTVDVASTGEEGIERIKNNDYGVVFLDIFLNKLNSGLAGFEIMRQIVEIKPELPIVLITGFFELNHSISEEDLSVPYAILYKPIPAKVISRTIENILAGKKLPPSKAIRIPVRDEITFSQRLADVIAQSQTGDYRKVIEEIVKKTTASAAAIFRMDPITQTIEIIDSVGVEKGKYEKTKYQLQYSPIKNVIEEGEFIYKNHVEEKIAKFDHLLSLIEFNSCIGLPINTSAKCKHALFLFHPQKEHFSAKDYTYTQNAAILLGQAIVNNEMKNSLQIGQKFINIGRLNIGLEHEIRNRVGALSNYIAALEEDVARIKEERECLDDEIFCQRFYKSIKEIGITGKDLRDLSHLFLDLVESEDRIKLTGGEIIRCIEHVMAAATPLANQYKIKLAFEKVERVPANLKVSHDLLFVQILLNIVLNALQFISLERIKEKTGEVKILLSYQGDDDLPVKIRVKDNGPGIHKKYFDRIFDILYSTKSDGTGLGLYLCREMIKSLEGRIRVEETLMPTVIGTKEDEN